MKTSSFIIIIIISTICYANTLQNGFVCDDDATIVNGLIIKKISNIPHLFDKKYFSLSGEITYRPITTLTYFIDYEIFGLRPWGFHLTNILLHAMNGLLIYCFLLAIHISSSNKPSRHILEATLFIVLLFTTHPVLTEAVNGVSFREDLLVTGFFISSLLLYIKAASLYHFETRKSAMLYAISCFFYFLALLSKEMAASFPLIVYCYERICREDKNNSGTLFLFNIGYVILTLIYLFLRFFLNPAEQSLNYWPLDERVLTLPLLILNYLKLTLFPISLSADYNINPVKSIHSFKFIASLSLVLFLLSTAFLIRKKQNVISFGIIFFFTALMPVYNLIPLNNPFAERYLYLPSLGLCIVFAAVAGKIYVRPDISKFAVWIIVPMFFFLTVQRNQVWFDDFSFWSDVLLKAPRNSRAHFAMGTVYDSKGMLDKAMVEYNESLGLAYRSDVLNAIGLTYYKKNMIKEAIMAYRKVLELEPAHRNARYNLALLYHEQGMIDEAVGEYRIILRDNPDDFDALNSLGYAYSQKGLFKEALVHYRKAMSIDPGTVAPYNNIGMVYATAGETGEAEKWFRKGQEIDPNSAEAHYNLGLLYQRNGRMAEAIESYNRAIEIRPDYGEAKSRLKELRKN